METEDFIDIEPHGVSDGTNELHMSNSEQNEVDNQLKTSKDITNLQNFAQSESKDRTQDVPCLQTRNFDEDIVQEMPVSHDNIKLVESVQVVEKTIGSESLLNSAENGSLTTLSQDSVEGEVKETYITGNKRARLSSSPQQPSVRIIYGSLTRDSKKKLEELMQRWSQWHAYYDSLPAESSNEALESGEETYFPALYVGSKNSKAVSFWMDNQAKPDESKDFISLDADSVPLYDRGYALGLTSSDGSSHPNSKGIEAVDASRCFNCGSYNHSFKECPKPRDNAAVNNARKQHSLKRNGTGGPRVPTRYYQNSPGGKFEGLRPGFLGAETRQCLGIRENDPPPWLNRMRELGYPPGYLDSETEDEPSGITIFAEDESKGEFEDGEICEKMESQCAEKKKTAAFPGLNAPIPENADERLWAPNLSTSDSHKPSQIPGLSRPTEMSRASFWEPRWSRGYTDEGPPGVDPSELRHGPRYGGFDSVKSSNYQYARNNNPVSSAPVLGRSSSERDWRGSLPNDLDRWAPEGRHGSGSESSSYRKDRYEHRHHHRR